MIIVVLKVPNCDGWMVWMGFQLGKELHDEQYDPFYVCDIFIFMIPGCLLFLSLFIITYLSVKKREPGSDTCCRSLYSLTFGHRSMYRLSGVDTGFRYGFNCDRSMVVCREESVGPEKRTYGCLEAMSS